ncbi:eukaryotic translation initiation factor 2 subunit alpha homolog isoform X2 [Brassica rapa]|uniref:eukaryotic translation initiation factor 2 subunit alpha homolog isoform X2 n=1 Tax=Brassica campestris TaxID=3711 RepID=UPI00142D4B06|nr:eukaryotic translation initiation factor 2 subunit alpha homolog isoform X2 [Brassica rapa]XP_033146450.1 eukaryotic translation initiation factor 2 subunit alpha homolog isoform X2 [Brassica rapa]XP_048634597.1 eukaryotic translation initiation factor 2 subunit alpha homolog isoform X1 [Brassica napus]
MAESRTFLLCYPPRTIHHRSFFHFSLRSITQELYVNIGYRKHGHAFELSLCCIHVDICYLVLFFFSGLQDPDSVLGSLTREIKEVGPDGQEVTKVVPAVTEEDQGIEILTEAIAACTETIDQHKGKLVVKEAPRAVSERC